MAPNLDPLSISVQKDLDPYFFDYIHQIGDIQGFKKLKRLRLPDMLLLGNQYNQFRKYDFWRILHMLPPSLEVLDIDYPTRDMHVFRSNIAASGKEGQALRIERDSDTLQSNIWRSFSRLFGGCLVQ